MKTFAAAFALILLSIFLSVSVFMLAIPLFGLVMPIVPAVTCATLVGVVGGFKIGVLTGDMLNAMRD